MAAMRVLAYLRRRGTILGALLALQPAVAQVREAQPGGPPGEGAPALVRVTFITETRGAPGFFVFDHKLIPDYRPKIYGFFPATGIVLDEKDHVLSFLGYRWVDIHGSNLRTEVTTLEGRKHPARLVGIDQSLGVAVVHADGAGLKRTPLCANCEIRPDEIVVIPVFERVGSPAEFQRARIVGVAAGERAGRGARRITLSNPLRGFGEPLLNRARQVLGFIADGDLFFPISQLLTSAEKVLQAGGDIRTGWLGVYVEVEDPELRAEGGVKIKSVENGSPAHKAGLLPGDILRTWNGREISDAREFIRTVQETPVGSQASVGILRQGSRMTLTALIEARRPQPQPERFVFSFPDPDGAQGTAATGEAGAAAQTMLGIETVSLTPRLAEILNMRAQRGLLVTDVEFQRMFGRAGVEVGDVITAVDGRPIASPAAFISHLQTRGPGAKVVLKLLRGGAERTIIVQLK